VTSPIRSMALPRSAEGHQRTSDRRCGMSVLAPEADVVRLQAQVRSVPISDLGQPAVKFTTVAEALKRPLNLGV
jgi:hypothetical protein